MIRVRIVEVRTKELEIDAVGGGTRSIPVGFSFDLAVVSTDVTVIEAAAALAGGIEYELMKVEPHDGD